MRTKMIHYLKHNQIDKGSWDDCIRKAVNSRVYAYSWYLDIVSPGWDGLVTDDYSCVFPLTHRQKGGIPYLYQPYFTQQLGLFSQANPTTGLMEAFLDAIPAKFRFAEIHLNALNEVNSSRYQVESRLNHELDLNRSYPLIEKNYDQNTRRNLRKSKDKNVKISHKLEADELTSLFRDHYGRKEGKLKPRDYQIMNQLIRFCLISGKGNISGAFTPDGILSASAFFLKTDDRVYFLFAASSPEARENGGMFIIIDQFIRENAGHPITLDFEGGNDPNLGRFYKSFGAAECTYTLLRINQLPWIVNKGINFVKKHR